MQRAVLERQSDATRNIAGLLFEVNRDRVAVRLPDVISGWRRGVAGSGRACRRCGPAAFGSLGCGRSRRSWRW